MTLIASENPRLTNWLKREFWAEQGFCRLAVTANEASETTYKSGTVLGKVTADGKYKVSVETAVDGSETAAAVVIEEVTVPAATDTTVLVLVKGPAIVADGGLILDASYNDDVKKQAAYDALEAKDINVDKQI